MRIQFSSQRAQLSEVLETGEALITNVPLIREVQIPVAVRVQCRGQCFHSLEMGSQALEPWRARRPIAAGKCDIDDHPPLIAFGKEMLQPGEEWFSRVAGC